MEDAKLRVPERDGGVFRGHCPQRDAVPGDDLREFSVSGQVRIEATDPDFRNGELPEYEQEAVHVVRMGMGQNHEIQPVDAMVPQKRRNDPPSDVEAVIHGASAVYEDSFARAELDERAV